MQLTDTLEIEETLGGFQASIEDQFLLNELDSYPGDTSRFFTGIPSESNDILVTSDDYEETVISEGEDAIPSYQSDISLDDEFDLSSIPTGKPSDFGYDDGRPSSSPFNEDGGDASMFDISGVDDFIHSAEQTPTPIVDNSPAVEPIRIQLDEPIFDEEPTPKAVKTPKVKKPSKPLDRRVVIIFTLLVSSMMVTMTILILLWKNKQDKEALYAMKASQLHHTSPHGQKSLQDSLSHGINSKTTVGHASTIDSTIIHSHSKDSTYVTHVVSKESADSLSSKNHSTSPSKVVAHSTPHSKVQSTSVSKSSTEVSKPKKTKIIASKDSDNSTSSSNIRSTVSSKTKVTPEYALKVHSSYSKVDAYSKAEQLRKEGVENVTVTEQKIRDRTIYNVRYGKFSSFNDAEAASKKTSLPSRWIDRTK
jgi:hypothetical protein